MSEPDELDITAMRRALIERMASSPAFAGSPASVSLLWFLFKNGEKNLSGKEIDSEFLKRPHLHVDGNTTRQQVLELRKRIRKYHIDAPQERLLCILPDAGHTAGYQLRFEQLDRVSACRNFWSVHLQFNKEVPVVCSRLLFYWDDTAGMMFRFMDTNIEGTGKQEALDVLKHRHRKHYKEDLIPGHLYVDAGSVAAAEIVREYFRMSNRHLPLVLDKFSNPDWLKSSPIVIGNVRNTPSMKRVLSSPAAERLAYRLDEEKFCGITIKNPKKSETDAFAAMNIEVDADGSFCEPFTNITIGIVTRIPNPGGSGAMTFISADGTFMTEQLATALTNESQLRVVFAKMGWSIEAPIPERFELMFKARLWPANFDDQATEAELICGRA